jgi:hypothetical protein
MMKRYGCLLTLFLFFSCNSLFHKEDNEYILVDKEQEKIDLINGVYQKLVEVHNEFYFGALCRSDDINIYAPVSNAVRGGSCSQCGYDLNFPEVTDNIFLRLYTAIVTINSLLPQLSDSNDAALMGELFFLRGYCYFKLARLFGTPPLITDIDVDYTVKKPTYLEVYEFIEEDLLNALQLLPATYTEARIPSETPHQGTAKALLAEVYLAWAGFPINDISKYGESAKYAGEVIQNADYYNYKLLDDYADLWKVDHRYTSEYIFGLFFDPQSDDNHNRIGGLCSVGSRNSFVDYSTEYLSEFKFYASFPNNYRKYNSYITGQYALRQYVTPDTTISSLDFVPYDPSKKPCDYINGAFSRKWIDFETYNSGDVIDFFNESINVTLYLLRYAQTLLTYAEASARSGKIDGTVYEAVNKIRRRANNVDLLTPSVFDLPQTLTKEQFIDSVVWERAWELCFEPEGRWFDIVRLDLKDKLPENRFKNESPNVVPEIYLSSDWYFYLIPQHDRWLNPNYE